MDAVTLRDQFEKHGFTTQFFSSKEEAAAYLAQEIQGQSIGFGGSVTLKEMGLFEVLQQNNAVVWHNKVLSMDVRHFANQANVYITSANAVTKTGQIVNIDGTGNRVSMTAFGPKICYYIVGKNKITGNLEEALYRSKNIAAPLNAKRLGVSTPCARNGDKCYDCNSPERICRMTIILDRVPLGMKCEIIFIDEELGL